MPHSAQDRRASRVGLRPQRRVLGVHLLADDREPAGRHRRARPRAGRRRRRDVEHHRLQGSRDVRALRRRRRRGRRLGRRGRRRARFSISSTRSTAAAAHALFMPGGRQPAAAVARDRRPAAALREAGRTRPSSSSRSGRPRRSRRRILERNGLKPADLDLFVSHQANRRIIESATEKLGHRRRTR